MKIKEFMKDLYDFTDKVRGTYEKTCDTLKAGDPERNVTRIAVAMFATPDVIRSASEWGAELLIVHEPVFYNHWDEPPQNNPVYELKRKLIEDSGITIYRYHDHPHYAAEDLIAKGEVHYFGLKGTWNKGPHYGISRFLLDEPVTARDIAAALEKNLKIHHVRICGDPDMLCRKLSLAFGTPGHLDTELSENDLVMTGEICEWSTGELVRDSCQLGCRKALLVLGHIGSERDGMRLLVDIIQERYSQLKAKYFECGEVYSYTR